MPADGSVRAMWHIGKRAGKWGAMLRKSRAKPPSPFRCFNSSPEIIRLVVMMYVRFPLSLRNVEDLLFERGIDISHETVRYWWNRFGPLFASPSVGTGSVACVAFANGAVGVDGPRRHRCAILRSLQNSGKETVRGTD